MGRPICLMHIHFPFAVVINSPSKIEGVRGRVYAYMGYIHLTYTL